MSTSSRLNGMCRSASAGIWRSSSAAVMRGRAIFLTITECPEIAVAMLRVRHPSAARSRPMASTTALWSMIAPSTMACAGRGSMPKLTSCASRRPTRSSMALMALDPMSRPTQVVENVDSSPMVHHTAAGDRRGDDPQAAAEVRSGAPVRAGASDDDAVLLDLVEQRAMADLEELGGPCPVPLCLSESTTYEIFFGSPGRALDGKIGSRRCQRPGAVGGRDQGGDARHQPLR